MSKQSIPYKEAFRFLKDCAGCELDFSSAQPFHKDLDFSFKDQKSQVHGFSRGSVEVLDACEKFFKKHSINCDKDNIALLKDGVLDAIIKAYKFLDLQSSDRVLVFTPTFGYYLQQLAVENIGFSTISSKKEDGFLPDLRELEEVIKRDKTKVLLICYPNNPTGAVMTKEYAQKLAALAHKYNLFIISDEIFLMNNLTENPLKHYPIAAVEGMIDRSLTVTATTKAVGHSTFRMGFCVGGKAMVENFATIGGHQSLNEALLMSDLEEGYENAQYLEVSRRKYLENIDIIRLGALFLNDILQKKFNTKDQYIKLYNNPEVGNVLMLDFSGLRGKAYDGEEIKSGLDIAKWMLKEAGVGMVPGECFLFQPEEMLVRVALGYEKEKFIEAFEKLGQAAEKISENPKEKTSITAAEAIKLSQKQSLKAKL